MPGLALQHNYCGIHAATCSSQPSCPGAGSSFPLRLPLAARGMGRGRHQADVHHADEAEGQEWWQKPKIAAPPYLARQMSKWFYDTSAGAATGAARYGSFVGEGFGLLVVSYR
jgi:hypothetical protein